MVLTNSSRTLGRALEANPILLGGLPAGIAVFSSAQKQRVGDTLADTVVVSRHALRTIASPDGVD